MTLTVSIGRCTTIASPLHRLDPRVKILSLVALVTLSFFLTTIPTGLYLSAIALAGIALSRVPARTIWRTIRPFLVFLFFSFIVNALCITSGSTLLTLGFVTLTTGGITAGLTVTWRALIALIFGILLVSTTTPVALADALESLMKPLRIFGVPTQDIAMILAVALRTIPLLSEEAAQITQAQKSRGAGRYDHNLFERLKAYASLIVPLLGTSLRHAERLAQAMETRCYAACPTRTHLHSLRFCTRDAIGILVVLALCGGFIALASFA
ncbi:MAG: energy-coupling factor transporter transmembrane component T [Raoultibacter sp.]